MHDILHIGQWQGFFQYGAEYGEPISGQEAEFRLFVEQYSGGQFSGRIIDWEGVGAGGEVATVKGFMKNDFISFTKQYGQLFGFDELGNTYTLAGQPGHCVAYEGHYDATTKLFTGTWEIRVLIAIEGDRLLEDIASGTWRMTDRRDCA